MSYNFWYGDWEFSKGVMVQLCKYVQVLKAGSQNSWGKEDWARRVSLFSTMTRFLRSTTPFCSYVCGQETRYIIPLFWRKFDTLRYSAPQSVCKRLRSQENCFLIIVQICKNVKKTWDLWDKKYTHTNFMQSSINKTK